MQIQLKKNIFFGVLFIASLMLWFNALPVVTVHYSNDGKKELRYIWATHNSTYKEQMSPGQSTFNLGQIFPDKNSFMMFDWWTYGDLRHCIYITPKWPTTNIYLNSNGDIDFIKTDPTHIARVKQCPWDNTNLLGD
jgi:hypothetical protein